MTLIVCNLDISLSSIILENPVYNGLSPFQSSYNSPLISSHLVV
jgi:hypothetical protein